MCENEMGFKLMWGKEGQICKEFERCLLSFVLQAGVAKNGLLAHAFSR